MSHNWREQESWPFDAARHVLLLRAIHQLGIAMSGEGWAENFSSRNAVTRAVRQWCASEQLAASWQAPGGMCGIDAHKWSGVYSSAWVTTGKLSDADAYGHGGQFNRSENPRHWIFVDREQLGRLVEAEQARRAMKSAPALASNNRAGRTRPVVDRSPKKNYDLEKQLLPWAMQIFAEVENGQRIRPRIAEFEKLARKKFLDVSIPLIRKEVWSRRPASWPHRGKKGA